MRDRGTFRLLAGLPEAPASAVGFHAQQAIEKALKAVSVLWGLETRRTHDLVAIAQGLVDAGCHVPVGMEDLRMINPFAVEVRYDDEFEPRVSRTALIESVDRVIDWANGMSSAPARPASC